MADAKKKKPVAHEGGGGGGDEWLYVIAAIAVILIIYFGAQSFFNVSPTATQTFTSKITGLTSILFSSHTWYVVGIVSSLMSIFFIGVIIFSVVRMREIQLHEKDEIAHEIALALARDAENDKHQNPRWVYVLSLIEGSSESDWRVAIMEADSMLDDIMKEKGFGGDSLGERLTSVRVSGGFVNIENAWEAHTLRNKIAHEGANFPLSQMEARRAIRLYELCFEEFGIL